MSVVVPGTGQIYRCKNVEGLVWFVVTALGYLTNLALGVAVHALCVWHAGSASTFTAERSAARGSPIKPKIRPVI